ncbi:hypothetical protein MCOR21_005049 [Pyricularia oryzae]|uniref:Thioredoxin domain-containing protein n=2 Tax=Pyricularia TaxID=48558 RepID=A0ABQ8NP17_PYRGI|nr:hypothetical protein MCOR33_004288 [Pyricularia grisea]KAI6347196.1 hypothetical protein MCOR30_000516 [Pyricularia oryzae]KAI6429362.1 hypothetical protein MCOR21_005049 [Pyricularia oryzae]KAI6489756.1 hypothetical protein MCOR11_007780 [Pyricularia oryzae]KAI6502335.1 hypothetical protein MCOR13_005395 [Pyricularia oryzae]
MTVHVTSAAQWRQILSSSSVVITDFYADWCGPCKMIAPTFESLSTKYSKPNRITFCKVDVDSQREIAQQYAVSAMPTFLILKSGSVVETIKGANPPALTAAVERAVKLAGPATGGGAAFSGGGQRLGGGGGPSGTRSGPRQFQRPGNWDLNSIINSIIVFFGLYFVSLFSFDPYKAAESSKYNIKNPPARSANVKPAGSAGARPAARRAPSSMRTASLRQYHATRIGITSSQQRNLSTTRSLNQTPPETPASSQGPSQSATEQAAPADTQKTTSEDAPLEYPERPEGEATPEEIEQFVRETKATFGDTLPPHFLYEEEYQVYQRLFGPPLRATEPEDIGIGSIAIEDGVDSNGEPGHRGPALLREDGQGGLEEVEYTPALKTREAADAEAGEETDADLEADLEALNNDPRIKYLQGVAKNQRQYEALLQLQADFEAASLQSLLDEDAKIAAAEAEMVQAAQSDDGATAEQVKEFSWDVQAGEELDAAAYKAREMDQWDEGHRETDRLHELTLEGQSRTNPSTIFIPKESIIEPITKLLKRTDPKHVKEAAETVFGGPGLPYSARTPYNMRNAKQVGVALRATDHRMSEIEADAYMATVLPTTYSTITSILSEVRKRLGTEWLRGLMQKNEGKGPRVLDVGAAGAGLLAWQHVVEAEWGVMQSEGIWNNLEAPIGKRTALVGSNFLRHRVSQLLENTTFIPRLPDYLHSAVNVSKHIDAPAEPKERKTYDVIIMSHILMPLDKQFKREALLDNLWSQLNPDGGILIVMEKGHPRGFEAVADVRMRLLDEFIVPPGSTFSSKSTGADVEDHIQTKEAKERVREHGMIIAPCTNHKTCPMYQTPGFTFGRRDFCHFSQRFIRPPFFQKVLGGVHQNHEDVDYSYLAVRRGGGQSAESSSTEATTAGDMDTNTRKSPPGGPWQGKEATDRAFEGYGKKGEAPPSMLSLPRNILPPLKRTGHVVMDVCTPDGNIERWTVPKSHGKQAYHDARKARWGDLWALGARQRELRKVRLGKPGTEVLNDRANPLGGKGDGGVRARRALAQAQARSQLDKINLDVSQTGNIEGASNKARQHQVERRTKKGRLPPKQSELDRLKKESNEDEFDDDEDMDPEVAKALREMEQGGRR